MVIYTPIHASKPSVYKYHPLVPNFSHLTSSKTSTVINPDYSFYTFVHFQILYFIMGVFTYEAETTTVIPSARLFKAFVLDADNLIPKIAPQAIKSAEIIEGNGGPGTIKKVNFGEGKFMINYHLSKSLCGLVMMNYNYLTLILIISISNV